MRRLLLLRHAKAAPFTGRDDYRRALTERGRDDARRVGELIAASGRGPELLIFSGAERTRQTAEIVAARLSGRVESIADNGLYEATRQYIFMKVRALPDRAGVAMLVGHNPGIGELANLLAGSGGDRARMSAKFPTCALAMLDFSIERWADAAPGAACLVRFVTPGDIRDPSSAELES
jgi:phosphohistidine phosphatase